MTRLFLAAGVAALAISAPAFADKGGHGGGGGDPKGGQAAAVQQQPHAGGGGGGQRAQSLEQRGGGGGGQRAQVFQQRGGGGFAVQRPQRVERMAAPRMERVQRVQMRAERQQARPMRIQQAQTRQIERQQFKANRVQQAQTRQLERQNRVQQAQTRQLERQQLRSNGAQQAQARQFERQQLKANGALQAQNTFVAGNQLRADRFALKQNQKFERQALRADNVAQVQALAANRVFEQPYNNYGTRVLPLSTAATFVGVPLATAATYAAFNPLPQQVQYLYPDTPDYYYRYGDGNLYQVDRGSNLIAALLPLLGGGYMPGSYLPQSYMSSYVPDYYGYNSFYPSSYAGYGSGYGYDNLCNRYYNGVVYQVDCVTGLVENVIPTYAGGYGVGQLLPSNYSTYNVPYQYRSMYYDTPSANYWYAPGAIYQYDPGSSLITSVAALLSPGFSVGQPLPLGYSAYNVPYDYRQTYYDTPNAWYRYNNGYIYQVDPATQLVSAVVASLLT